MSKSAELSRKEMKGPDQFQVAAGEAATWLTGHRRQAIAAGVVVVVLAVVAVLVSWNSERKHAGAAALLSEVYRAAGGEVSAVPLPGLPGPFFTTDELRQRAVIDAAGKLLNEYPGTRPSALAALAKGDAHLRLGELDQAAAAYQLYLTTARANDSFRFSALQGQALVAEGKGDLQGALDGWSKLGGEVPAMADRADLERARLLVALNRDDDARRLLEGFSAVHKNSPLSGEAAERLARLGGR
jgi:tetratricopeptide (TPR) repeat protein